MGGRSVKPCWDIRDARRWEEGDDRSAVGADDAKPKKPEARREEEAAAGLGAGADTGAPTGAPRPLGRPPSLLLLPIEVEVAAGAPPAARLFTAAVGAPLGAPGSGTSSIEDDAPVGSQRGSAPTQMPISLWKLPSKHKSLALRTHLRAPRRYRSIPTPLASLSLSRHVTHSAPLFTRNITRRFSQYRSQYSCAFDGFVII